MSINTFNTRLVNDEFKFEVYYKSPKIECRIQSKSLTKALDNCPIYKRLSQNKDYKEGEEIYNVMEQTKYNEFAGSSDVTITYNGKVYYEQGTNVIDGVDWDNGKRSPDGYHDKKQSFFNDTFYVLHPNRDALNGKKTYFNS